MRACRGEQCSPACLNFVRITSCAVETVVHGRTMCAPTKIKNRLSYPPKIVGFLFLVNSIFNRFSIKRIHEHTQIIAFIV